MDIAGEGLLETLFSTSEDRHGLSADEVTRIVHKLTMLPPGYLNIRKQHTLVLKAAYT